MPTAGPEYCKGQPGYDFGAAVQCVEAFLHRLPFLSAGQSKAAGHAEGVEQDLAGNLLELLASLPGRLEPIERHCHYVLRERRLGCASVGAPQTISSSFSTAGISQRPHFRRMSSRTNDTKMLADVTSPSTSLPYFRRSLPCPGATPPPRIALYNTQDSTFGDSDDKGEEWQSPCTRKFLFVAIDDALDNVGSLTSTVGSARSSLSSSTSGAQHEVIGFWPESPCEAFAACDPEQRGRANATYVERLLDRGLTDSSARSPPNVGCRSTSSRLPIRQTFASVGRTGGLDDVRPDQSASCPTSHTYVQSLLHRCLAGSCTQDGPELVAGLPPHQITPAESLAESEPDSSVYVGRLLRRCVAGSSNARTPAASSRPSIAPESAVYVDRLLQRCATKSSNARTPAASTHAPVTPECAVYLRTLLRKCVMGPGIRGPEADGNVATASAATVQNCNASAASALPCPAEAEPERVVDVGHLMQACEAGNSSRSAPSRRDTRASVMRSCSDEVPNNSVYIVSLLKRCLTEKYVCGVPDNRIESERGVAASSSSAGEPAAPFQIGGAGAEAHSSSEVRNSASYVHFLLRKSIAASSAKVSSDSQELQEPMAASPKLPLTADCSAYVGRRLRRCSAIGTTASQSSGSNLSVESALVAPALGAVEAEADCGVYVGHLLRRCLAAPARSSCAPVAPECSSYVGHLLLKSLAGSSDVITGAQGGALVVSAASAHGPREAGPDSSVSVTRLVRSPLSGSSAGGSAEQRSEAPSTVSPYVGYLLAKCLTGIPSSSASCRQDTALGRAPCARQEQGASRAYLQQLLRRALASATPCASPAAPPGVPREDGPGRPSL